MTQTPELLPCPFCGGEPLVFYIGGDDGGYGAVECDTCGQAWAHEDDTSTAAEAWNTRAMIASPGIYSLPGDSERIQIGRKTWVPEASHAALVAAAYEDAADTIAKETKAICAVRHLASGENKERWTAIIAHRNNAEDDCRARTPDHAKAALDAMLAEARKLGKQESLAALVRLDRERRDGGPYMDAILALLEDG